MITSFRMYNATPAVAAGWRALFGRVFEELGLPIEIVEHRWPQPIETLWSEPGLCCAFMCGWPFAKAPGMQAIAAPVPSLPRYAGLPRYCSEFLVRKASGWRSLEETFGHRYGWMARNSHSGFNAPRAHLARFASAERPALFSEVVGPLGNPALALQALAKGEVDVIALDGFYLDLVRRHEPERLAELRTVAITDWAPIPLLVAAPGIEASIVERLAAHLCAVHDDPALSSSLEAVCVRQFVRPSAEAYAGLELLASRALASAYPDIR